MKKKTKIYITIAIISVILSLLAIYVIISTMFKAQYNSHGISHLLVVTIDDSSSTYIGDLEGHKVYLEGMNIKETVFRSIKAKNVSIKEVLDQGLTSIKEWEEYAWSIRKMSDGEILRFDNYEIYVTKDVCIIRPITK